MGRRQLAVLPVAKPCDPSSNQLRDLGLVPRLVVCRLKWSWRMGRGRVGGEDCGWTEEAEGEGWSREHVQGRRYGRGGDFREYELKASTTETRRHGEK